MPMVSDEISYRSFQSDSADIHPLPVSRYRCSRLSDDGLLLVSSRPTAAIAEAVAENPLVSGTVSDGCDPTIVSASSQPSFSGEYTDCVPARLEYSLRLASNAPSKNTLL